MKNFVKKHRTALTYWYILLLGLFARIILGPYFESGDLLAYQEWGRNIWELGPKNFYFGYELWEHSVPNYPPLMSLLFGGAYWLFEHKYWLAQLHNLIKIPPAFIIEYFYEHGYSLILRTPSILADLVVGGIIYNLVFKISKKTKTALIAMAVFVLNPVTIFISGIWGQTDSFVSLFGLLAFLLLLSKKKYLSIPVYFISLYLKPSWAIFLPLYLFLMIDYKIKLKEILIGVIIALVIFLFTTYPFSGSNLVGFTLKLFSERLPIAVKADTVASVSAFNFHSLFFQIDRDFSSTKLLGISAKSIGSIAYLLINLLTFSFIRKQKSKILALISALFIVGFGSFLLLTGMLERYFFIGFAPLIILMFTKPKILAYGILINIIVMANLVWSFFRRKYDEIGHPFTNNNFFLIRALSLACLLGWSLVVRQLRLSKR